MLYSKDMKKAYKRFFAICILFLLATSVLYAQHGMRRRGHSKMNENLYDRALDEYYSDFYIEKLYCTIEQNTIEINIHFSKSVDPESLKEENIELYEGRTPLSVEFMYNRSGDQVQINAVFDSELNLAPLDISLTETRNIRGTLLENSSFSDIEPIIVYEYTREGKCHMY